MDDGGAARRRLQERHLLLQEEHEIRADGDERRGDGIHEHRARGDVSSAFNDDPGRVPAQRDATRRRARECPPVPERLPQSSELSSPFRGNADVNSYEKSLLFPSSVQTARGRAADAMPRFVQGVAVGATPSISADASHRGWRLPAGKRKLAGALLAAFVFLALLRDAMDGTRALEHADVDPARHTPRGSHDLTRDHAASRDAHLLRPRLDADDQLSSARVVSGCRRATSGAHRDRSGFPTS